MNRSFLPPVSVGVSTAIAIALLCPFFAGVGEAAHLDQVPLMTTLTVTSGSSGFTSVTLDPQAVGNTTIDGKYYVLPPVSSIEGKGASGRL